MPTLTNISLSLMTLATASLTACTQVSSIQHFSASEPSSQTVCDQPVHEHSYVATCISTTSQQPNTPIRDISSSAQVITRPVIDDQKALTFGDALRNVSGVQGR
jgi:iron complex outermembrane receptor protein